MDGWGLFHWWQNRENKTTVIIWPISVFSLGSRTHLFLCFVAYLCWVCYVHRGHQWCCSSVRTTGYETFRICSSSLSGSLYPHKVARLELVGRYQANIQPHEQSDDCRRTWMDLGKEWLVISVLGASSYKIHLSHRRAKGRRLVQYSPVSRTYLDHVSFLFILPVFPELCVLYVHCGFQSTFSTLDRFRKDLVLKTRPLLNPREKGDCNPEIISTPE